MVTSAEESPTTGAREDRVSAQDTELLELVLEAAADGIMDWDFQTNVVRYNDRWKLMLGYEHDLPGVGPLWKQLSHPADLPRVEELLADHLDNLWPFYHTWRMRHHNGEWRWIFCRAVTARDAHLQPTRLVAIFSDVSDRVHAEERQRAMVSAVPDLLLRVGAGGIILDVKLPESAGAADAGLVWPTARTRLAEWPAAAAWHQRITLFVEGCNGGAGAASACFEASLNWSGGPTRSVEIRLVRSGEHEALCMVRDVTEQRQLQAQLLQTHKLEAIGQLAAGIAHEINTPMQYIGDNLHFIRDGIESVRKTLEAYRAAVDTARQRPLAPGEIAQLEALREEEDVEYVCDRLPTSTSAALEGVERVSRIVRAMKEFSHPGGQEKAPVNLNREIETTIIIATNVWKHVADLETNLDPALPPVPCLRGEINQVILNLIVNAAHAIADVQKKGRGERGRIQVSTRAVGQFAEIRVADTGGGIPEKIRHRIFEPFFTTKDVGTGTGQGLSMARHTVVSKHGGTLEFETKEGEGTTFVVRLPLG